MKIVDGPKLCEVDMTDRNGPFQFGGALKNDVKTIFERYPVAKTR